ncbi:MAG: tRNA pseudouridine(54/55) synthase Pus10 [Methanocellales archaeon]|nr:tRNA pseudouridine(54/55) synthase Pus10 [Methanocellales archaeon]
MNLLDVAAKVLDQGPICDNCLGRQFAKLSTGLSNKERGAAIRTVLAMFRDQEMYKAKKCWVCNGLFDALDVWTQRAINALSDYEYDTFLVGTKVSGLVAENEEILWAESGTTHAEPLKSELNREVGKLIQSQTGKEVNFERPDIVVTLDLAENKVKLQVNPIFIYGKYRKLIRGIPQTIWFCPQCEGRGCESCKYTGKMYQTSIAELITPPVIKLSGGRGVVFHGAGREDIDARMLGTGRPFVLEVKEPMRRHFDLVKLRDEINKHAKDKIKVRNLKFVDKEAVEAVKSGYADKVYRFGIIFKKAIPREKLEAALDKLTKTAIKQRTPLRVAHRRADKIRIKRVRSATLKAMSNNRATIYIECEGGLYGKELISGDNGRTKPSLSELVGTDAQVLELDVMEVKEASHARLTRNKEKK